MNDLIKQEASYELSTGVFTTIENFKEIYDIGKMFASCLVPAYQNLLLVNREFPQ